MATRRMFSLSVVDSDAFLEMPASTQNLYFHLNMRADDDGFVNSYKKIIKITGASEDDLKILMMKKFILPFDSGVIVIKHWRINNLLRKDRYRETNYLDEKRQLCIEENGSYTFTNDNCIPNGNQMATDGVQVVDVGKDRIGKDSIVYNIVEKVIDKLNEKTGCSYKASTNKTITCINARLKEGFKLEDFYKVIDIKCNEWLNDEIMKKYLRPETLFGTKFEGYLNQGGVGDAGDRELSSIIKNSGIIRF